VLKSSVFHLTRSWDRPCGQRLRRKAPTSQRGLPLRFASGFATPPSESHSTRSSPSTAGRATSCSISSAKIPETLRLMALIFDTGAQSAIERRNRTTIARLVCAHQDAEPVLTTAAVVAQVIRNRSRQVTLERVLSGVEERPLDSESGTKGWTSAWIGPPDVVDTAVALLAQPTMKSLNFIRKISPTCFPGDRSKSQPFSPRTQPGLPSSLAIIIG
jgi:hypothetical protein